MPIYIVRHRVRYAQSVISELFRVIIWCVIPVIVEKPSALRINVKPHEKKRNVYPFPYVRFIFLVIFLVIVKLVGSRIYKYLFLIIIFSLFVILYILIYSPG